MEMHSTIAVWQGDGKVTVYDATQGISGVQKKIATVFDLKPDDVRVISHYVGGGFGCKGSPWSHIPLAVMAAKVTQRPVKVMLTRQQMFGFVGHRPTTSQKIALGADAAGKLVALRHETLSYTSQLDEFIVPSGLCSRMLYACDNIRTTHRLVKLDTSTPTFIKLDSTALVQAGSQDIGTGTYTIMTQIAADALGIPIEKVTFELGDTKLPPTPVSGGSATASSTGSAVKLACLAARAELVNLALADAASPLHGLAAGDVDVDGGALVSKKDKTKRDSIGDVVKRTGKEELSARSDVKPKEERKTHSCHSFGAQFVEARVDEATGEVRVSRVVSAFAAGKVLNAKTARSQFLGGIVWGIGLALTEETVRDARSGRVVNHSLQDYHVPVNADVPAIDVIMVDEKDPFVNEIGAKGMGEIGITGIGAAIANAVYHATGKRVRDLPIPVDKLL